MQKEQSIGRQAACLTAMLVIGNYVICFPLTSDDGSDLLSFAAAYLLSFLPILLFVPLLNRLFAYDRVWEARSRAGRCFLALAYAAAALWMLYTALRCAADFVGFADEFMLNGIPAAVCAVIFGAVVLFAVKGGNKLLLKLSLILLPVAAVLILLMFFLSLPSMSVRYIIPHKAPRVSNLLLQTVTRYADCFGQALLPAVIIAGIGGKKGVRKSLAAGNALGGAAVMIGMVNTLLIFGGGFASALPYAYSHAVSTVSLGEVFSRMDGFLYAVYFFSALVKASAAVFASVCLFRRLFGKERTCFFGA